MVAYEGVKPGEMRVLTVEVHDDQRQYSRCSFVRRIKFALVRDGVEGDWREGMSLDLSFGGIRFLAKQRLHAQDYVRIRLGLVTEEPGLLVTARVAYVRYEPSGEWLLGCDFLPTLAAVDEAWLEDETLIQTQAESGS